MTVASNLACRVGRLIVFRLARTWASALFAPGAPLLFLRGEAASAAAGGRREAGFFDAGVLAGDVLAADAFAGDVSAAAFFAGGHFGAGVTAFAGAVFVFADDNFVFAAGVAVLAGDAWACSFFDAAALLLGSSTPAAVAVPGAVPAAGASIAR